MNPITADNYAYRFNCTPVSQGSDPVMVATDAIHKMVWTGTFYILPGSFWRLFNWWFGFLLLEYSSGGVWHPRDLQVSRRCFCWVLIFVSLYALTVIYWLPVMINRWDKRLPSAPNIYMIYHYGSWGRELGSRKVSLSPPVIYCWPFQGSSFIMALFKRYVVFLLRMFFFSQLCKFKVY